MANETATLAAYVANLKYEDIPEDEQAEMVADAHSGTPDRRHDQGAAALDLLARHGIAIPLATLQTGRLHAETQALLPRMLAGSDSQVPIRINGGQQGSGQKLVHGTPRLDDSWRV